MFPGLNVDQPVKNVENDENDIKYSGSLNHCEPQNPPHKSHK